MKRVYFIIFGVLVFLNAQSTKAAPINENPASTPQVTATPTVVTSASTQDVPTLTPSLVTTTPTATIVQTQGVVSTLNPSPSTTSSAVVVSPTETEIPTNNPDNTARVTPKVKAYSTDNNRNLYLVIVLALSTIGTVIGSMVTIRRLKDNGVQK